MLSPGRPKTGTCERGLREQLRRELDDDDDDDDGGGGGYNYT